MRKRARAAPHLEERAEHSARSRDLLRAADDALKHEHEERHGERDADEDPDERHHGLRRLDRRQIAQLAFERAVVRRVERVLGQVVVLGADALGRVVVRVVAGHVVGRGVRRGVERVDLHPEDRGEQHEVEQRRERAPGRQQRARAVPVTQQLIVLKGAVWYSRPVWANQGA